MEEDKSLEEKKLEENCQEENNSVNNNTEETKFEETITEETSAEAANTEASNTETVTEIHEANDSESSKGKKIGLIIGAAIGVLIIAALVFCYVRFWGNAKYQLVKAIGRLAEDENSYSEALCSDEDRAEIINAVSNGNAKMDYSFNLAGIEDLPVTLGIDGELIRRYEDKKMSLDAQLSVMNVDAASVEVCADDNDLYVHVPELFDETFTADTTTLADDFNASALSEYTGIELPDSMNFYLFEERDSDEEMEIITAEEFAEDYSEDILAAYKAMDVSKLKGKETFRTDDGTEMKCKVYEATLPEDELNTLYSDYLEKANISVPDNDYINPDAYELASDAVLDVLVDQDGYVREIKSVEAVDLSEFRISFDMSFTGAEVETDNIVFAGAYEDEVDAFDIEASLEQGVDGTRNLEITTDGDINIGFIMEEQSDYDDDLNSLGTELERLEIDANGEELFHISGNCEIEPTDETVEVPTDNVLDVMHMGLLDLLGLATELQDKLDYLNSLSDMLGGII